VVLPSAGVEQAVEIQADTFLNSLFDGAELSKEIEVIIQESKQKRDSPTYLLLQSMYACAFDRRDEYSGCLSSQSFSLPSSVTCERKLLR